MIKREGDYTCERCGKNYHWDAIKLESGDVIVGRLDSIKSHNVDYFDVINGRLIATGYCPYCKTKQMVRLVDEEC